MCNERSMTATEMQTKRGWPHRDTQVVTDHEKVTIATIEHVPTFRVTGSAVKHPDDEFDRYLGEDLARARALMKLGLEVYEEAVRICQQGVDLYDRTFEEINSRENMQTFSQALDQLKREGIQTR